MSDPQIPPYSPQPGQPYPQQWNQQPPMNPQQQPWMAANPEFVPIPARKHGVNGFRLLLIAVALTIAGAFAPHFVPGFEDPLRGQLDEIVILYLGGYVAVFALIIVATVEGIIGWSRKERPLIWSVLAALSVPLYTPLTQLIGAIATALVPGK